MAATRPRSPARVAIDRPGIRSSPVEHADPASRRHRPAGCDPARPRLARTLRDIRYLASPTRGSSAPAWSTRPGLAHILSADDAAHPRSATITTTRPALGARTPSIASADGTICPSRSSTSRFLASRSMRCSQTTRSSWRSTIPRRTPIRRPSTPTGSNACCAHGRRLSRRRADRSASARRSRARGRPAAGDPRPAGAKGRRRVARRVPRTIRLRCSYALLYEL